jgi:hypothetical protein
MIMKNNMENAMWLFDLTVDEQNFINCQSNSKFYLSVYPRYSYHGESFNVSNQTTTYRIYREPQSVVFSVAIGYEGDQNYLGFLEFVNEKDFMNFLKEFNEKPTVYVDKPYITV